MALGLVLNSQAIMTNIAVETIKAGSVEEKLRARLVTNASRYSRGVVEHLRSPGSREQGASGRAHAGAKLGRRDIRFGSFADINPLVANVC